MFSSNDQNFKRDVKILFYIGVISYVTDICVNYTKQGYFECGENKLDKLKFHLLLVIHHIIWSFASFGFISNNNQLLRIYVLISIIYLSHWKLNNDNCFITQWIAKICGFSSSYRLQHLIDILSNNKMFNSRNSQRQYLILFTIIAIIKINNKN